MVRIRLVLALALIVPVAAAMAQGGNHYRWVDGKGHTHISDEVPASAARFGYDVINKYGRVLYHVDGAKSAEQIAAAKRAAELAQQQREEARQDRNLLLTYPTEQSLLRAQDAQESMTEQRIHSTRINMKSQLKHLGGLLERAGTLQQQGKPVPKYIRDQIDEQRKVIRKQATWISDAQQELARIRADNSRVLRHYRTLKTPDTQKSSRSPTLPAHDSDAP